MPHLGIWIVSVQAGCSLFLGYNSEKLFDARHSYIAHSLLREPETATYNALFATVYKTAEIVSELSKLIGLNTVGFEPHRQTAQFNAEAYWDALIDGKVRKLPS